MPIMPDVIHTVPNVTIERLATALYYVGRAALRAEKASPERAKAELALMVNMIEETLTELP